MPIHHIITVATTAVDSHDVLDWIIRHPPLGLVSGERVVATPPQVRELFAASSVFRAWAARAYVASRSRTSACS